MLINTGMDTTTALRLSQGGTLNDVYANLDYVGGASEPEPEPTGTGGTVDMASVAALGYGDLTADELAELVAGGAVYQHKDKNGRIYFTKAGQGR